MASGRRPARVSDACSGEMPRRAAKSAMGPEPRTWVICSGLMLALAPVPIQD